VTAAPRSCRKAAAFALLLAAIVPLALAQTSVSAGVVSDYRYRGMSLSEEAAAPQLSLNHDAESGAYLGLSLSGARLPYTRTDAQAIGYAGIARSFGTGMAWEIGVSQTAFLHAGRYNYHELFAGLNMERFGARLYLSPRYLGVGGRSVYAEINGSRPLSEVLDLVAHLGYLRPSASPAAPHARAMARADLSIGVSATLDAWTLQLTWSATREGAALYPGARGAGARKAVLSSAYQF
jgi:uncharacterized protein (TIGR02001 family)